MFICFLNFCSFFQFSQAYQIVKKTFAHKHKHIQSSVTKKVKNKICNCCSNIILISNRQLLWFLFLFFYDWKHNRRNVKVKMQIKHSSVGPRHEGWNDFLFILHCTKVKRRVKRKNWNNCNKMQMHLLIVISVFSMKTERVRAVVVVLGSGRKSI